MPKLSRYENIRGGRAKTVAIDMTARERKVEFAEELPLRHTYEATNEAEHTIPMGNLFRELGFAASNSLLDWVYLPAWQDREATVWTAYKNFQTGEPERDKVRWFTLMA